jgi:hypothetical protein
MQQPETVTLPTGVKVGRTFALELAVMSLLNALDDGGPEQAMLARALAAIALREPDEPPYTPEECASALRQATEDLRRDNDWAQERMLDERDRARDINANR